MPEYDWDIPTTTKTRQVQKYLNSQAQKDINIPKQDRFGQRTDHSDSRIKGHSPSPNHVDACRAANGAHSLLKLQKRFGNRFVQRALAQAKSAGSIKEVNHDIERSIQRARGGGRKLDSGIRAQMEPSFGADFSSVRVHTDSQSDSISRSLNARAFTSGKDIFFRQSTYNQGSSSGRELIAHELTHVVQQSGPKIQPKLTVGKPGDIYEQEADHVARTIMHQEYASGVTGTDQKPVQRQADEDEEAPVKAKFQETGIQRQGEEEEEPVQTELETPGLQRQPEEEEELVQTKADASFISRQSEEEEETA